MELKFAGIQISVAVEPATAARLYNSPAFRYLVRPGLAVLSKVGKKPPAPAPPPAGAPAAVPDFQNEEAAAIWEQVAGVGWYHTIDLGHGIATPGFIDNRPTVDRFGLPADLTGKRCLDIGTYDGFWAFEMERRGAAEVIAIDVDSRLDHDLPRPARQLLLNDPELLKKIESGIAEGGLQLPGEGFRCAKEILGSKVVRKTLSVYDLSPEKVGMFDVVLISQLLLRLRDPQTVIENMFSVCRDIAIIGEPYDPGLEMLNRAVSEFVGTERVGAWWSHSIKSMRKMMEVAGFDPVEEVDRYPVVNRLGSFHKVILRGRVPSGAATS